MFFYISLKLIQLVRISTLFLNLIVNFLEKNLYINFGVCKPKAVIKLDLFLLGSFKKPI